MSRLASVLPIAPPRKIPQPVTVGDLTLPAGQQTLGGRECPNITVIAGSLVQINLYSLHRKKEIWIDPENFRPERFLDNGRVVQVLLVRIKTKL